VSNVGDLYAGLTLIAGPNTGSPSQPTEPLTLSDAKTHLRIPDAFTNDDQYISLLIQLARQECEAITHRAFINQTWQLALKNWPGRDYQNWPTSLTSEIDMYYKYNFIQLPLASPLQSVNVVQYMDSSGTIWYMQPAGFQVLPGYTYNVCPQFEPGRIVLPFSQIWPTDILMPGAPILIQYTCGYLDVPTFFSAFEGAQAVGFAMRMMLAYAYENRIPPSEMRRSSINAGIEYVAEQLLTAFRVYE
jgi:hypothetical protein